MSGTGSFLSVSSAEADTGLSYARGKFGVTLDRDMLRTLADKTRARMHTSGESLESARFAVMREHLRQTDSNAQTRYKAYASAIGKIFADRRVQKRQAMKDQGGIAAKHAPSQSPKRGQAVPPGTQYQLLV